MRTRSLLPVSLLLVAAACGDEGASVVTSSSSQNGERVANGVYEVPVDAALAGAATYATHDIRWTVARGEARLKYDLPASIVGRSLGVDFRGTFDEASGKGTLEGAAGTAECTVTGSEVACRETMAGLLPLTTDREQVSAYAVTDGASIADRIKVADQFAKDPIGIIHFTVSPP